jgi:large subunit ribosomal protein L7/L12
MASEKIQGILDTVGALTVLELNELVSELQEQWGVTAAVAAAPAAAGAGAAEAAPAEAKTEFDVVLKDGGATKIQVIKAVREIDPSLGLKEAKELVDAAPKTVKEGVAEDEAKKIKEKLEAAGAVVEIK